MRKAASSTSGGWKTLAIIQLAISLQAEFGRGLEKRWLAEVEWNNPANWLNGALPEDGSLLVFPIEMRHAVGMPPNDDIVLTGLHLSLDGIIALPENGKLVLAESGKSPEKAREARWLRDGPFLWVDPLNWNTSSVAVPHLERVPCQNDVVVLPASSKVFSVKLPMSRDVEVQAVRLAEDSKSGATIASWDWRRMGERAEFMRSRFTVKYSPLLECDDCQCQEGDVSTYWEEVCDVQRPRCGLPACEYPLKVEGHCCYFCGGRVRLATKSLPGRARRAMKAIWSKHEAILDWHWRRTWDGKNSEILIAEKSDYLGSATLVALADVQAALRDEGLEVSWSESSGAPLSDYRLLMALGPFLGCFVLLLFLFLLLCPVFGYSYSQVWEACSEFAANVCIGPRVNGRRKKSFAFARFENISEGNVQLGDEEETHTHLISSERFENPLYNSQQKPRKSGQSQEKKLDPNEPVSLAGLQQKVEFDQCEEIEMDIENL